LRNGGTFCAMQVGHSDAVRLAEELGGEVTPHDLINLAERGFFAPYRPTTAEDVPPKWRDENNLYTCIGVCARVIAFSKLAEARHRRREKNLKLRQPTLPLECTEGVAKGKPGMSHCG
jgi:hypothetical protein